MRRDNAAGALSLDEPRGTVREAHPSSAPASSGVLTCVESFDDRARFIRAQTVLTEVPFVPEIRLQTAIDLAPIWRATQARLSDLGVDVRFWCVPWAGGQALAR